MHGVDRKGLAAGVLYILFGAATAIGSLQYPIGTFWRMGAGFFPLMVSLALILNGLVVAGIAVAPTARAVGIGKWQVRNLVLVTVAVVLFALLIRPAGIILSIAALVGVASFAEREVRLRDALLSILALSLLTWLVFLQLLGLPLRMLPPGLGF